MKHHLMLEGVDQRLLCLTSRRAGSPTATTVSPVFTVGDLCRRLGRSRRQVYRYLRAGRVQACGRILGQWLFDRAAVEEFSSRTLPGALRRFFWDARLSDLSAEQHRDFILARLLEEGDRDALRWVFRTYPRGVVAAFLRGRGAALLSRRAWRFWSLHLGLPGGPRRRTWRRRGRAWGGLR